ncbi:E3 ubiquitin-protein ligase RFI2 [Bienertia sinuspersici]
MLRSEDSSDQAIDLNVEPESSVPCSICLDLVTNGGERSRAKLKCGHEFHLDCIGSAFNMKGMMQCPNCREIEKGRWLYGSGSTNSSPEPSMDDGSVDSYPFYFTVSEMPYRVHICPFRGFTQVHPSSQSSLGVMSSLTPMVAHQHPGAGNPHPHGWVQFQQTSFLHHHHQASGLPMPITNGAGRFDTQRSMPRFVPPGRVYDPNPGFSHYAESSPVNYSHAWSRDNVPHFPMP